MTKKELKEKIYKILVEQGIFCQTFNMDQARITSLFWQSISITTERDIRNIFEILNDIRKKVKYTPNNSIILAIKQLFITSYADILKINIPLDIFIDYLKEPKMKKSYVKSIENNVNISENIYLENYELFSKYDVKIPKNASTIKLRKELEGRKSFTIEDNILNDKWKNCGLSTFVKISNKIIRDRYINNFKIDVLSYDNIREQSKDFRKQINDKIHSLLDDIIKDNFTIVDLSDKENIEKKLSPNFNFKYTAIWDETLIEDIIKCYKKTSITFYSFYDKSDFIFDYINGKIESIIT